LSSNLPLPLPAYPPWTYYPASPDSPTVTDVTDTALGREIHSLLAWNYNTGGGRAPWPTSYGTGSSPQSFYLAGYDRPARVVLFGSYGSTVDPKTVNSLDLDTFGNVWCTGVLEGSPLKSSCLIPDTQVMVRDETCDEIITGWHVVFARGTETGNFFYDPERRLLWKFGRDGDRYEHTRVWRVPHVTEVALPDPLPEGVVAAPRDVSTTRHTAWWVRRQPRMTARWQQRLDDALGKRCLVVPDQSDLPRELLPTWRTLCDQRGWGYSILRKGRVVSTWQFEPDALDRDRYPLPRAIQDQAVAYWQTTVVTGISKRYSAGSTFGRHGVALVLPTNQAFDYIPSLLAILDAGRSSLANVPNSP